MSLAVMAVAGEAVVAPSASSEGEDEIGGGGGHSEEGGSVDADADEGWQQVRDGAAALQQEISTALLLRRGLSTRSRHSYAKGGTRC